MGSIHLNLIDAFDQNPDEYAEHERIGRAIGLPGGLVNRDDMRAHRAKEIENAVKSLPVSSRLFADAKGAVLAQDDADNIAALEQATAARKLDMARLRGEVFKRQMSDPGLLMENLDTAYSGFRAAFNNRDMAQAVDAQLELDRVNAKGDERLNFEIQVWDDEIAREGGLDKLPKYRQEQYLALKERQKTAADVLRGNLIKEQDAAIDDYLADWQKTIPKLSLATERALAEFSRLEGAEKVRFFATNGRVAAHTLSDSLGRYAPAIATGAAVTTATVLTGGTAGVAGALGAAASGGVSYGTERASHITQGIEALMADKGLRLLDENGGTLTDEAKAVLREDIKALLAGSDLQTLVDEADARGASIAVMDALSMGTASWLYRAGRNAGRMKTAMVGAMGASAVYGAGGETLAQITSKGGIHDGADIAIEGIAEFMFGGAEFAAAGVSYGVKRLLTHHENRLARHDAAIAAAQQSKLRERAPEAFYQLAEELEEHGDHPHIYIDGNALADNGLIDALLAAAPEYEAAVKEAVDNGGAVQIKMADVLAKISPDTNLSQNIREHIRFEAGGLSLAELSRHSESELRDNAQEIIQAQEQEDAREGELQAIRDTVRDQLNAGGRFAPEAVESYALLAGSFYDRLAQDLGISPQEAMAAHPLQIANGEVQAQGYNQPVTQDFQWEYGQRRGLFGMADIPVVEIAGQELGADEKSIRANVNEQLKAYADGGLINRDTGWNLQVSASDRKKLAKWYGANMPALQSHAALEALVENAVLAESHRDIKHDNEDVVGIHRMYAPIAINGQLYRAKLTVRDYQGNSGDKTRLRRLEAIEIENAPMGTLPMPGANPQATAQPTSAHLDVADNPQPLVMRITDLLTGSKREDGTDWDVSDNVLFQQARGSYSPADGTITLTPNADLSTFIHEFGHHALETTVSVATRLTRKAAAGEALTKGEAKIVRDTQILLADVGLDLDAWNALSFEEKRPYHERIARTFETYVMTGQAPSLELAGAFARFKAWLLRLYKNMRNLNAPLSDEVKQVFDRMLATDTAIEEMRRARGLTPMYETAEEAGMTPEEFEAYREDWQQAKESGGRELEERALRDLRFIRNLRNRHLQKLQKEALEVRKSVEEGAREMLAKEPVYRADAMLRTKAQEGEPLLRFSQQALLDLGFSEVEIKALGSRVHKHGMHPDELAGFLLDADGNALYADGAAMVRDMLNMRPLKEAVADMADSIMLERHAELSSPAAIAEAADMAAYNEFSLRVLAQEANALAKATGKPGILSAAARKLAREIIDTKVIKDLKPQQFSRMATRAAKAAEAARQKGDIDTAAREKRNQVLQAALAREAYERKESVAEQVRHLKKRGRLDPKKIEIETREIIEATLARFGLAPAPQQSRPLEAWAAEKEAMGYDLDLADFVRNESIRRDWHTLTFGEFASLYDAVNTLEHIGKTERKAFLAEFQLDIADMADEMAASAEEHGADAPLDNRTPTTATGRALGMLRKIGWQHRKTHMLARQMDGNLDGGKVWRHLILPTNRQGDLEVELRAEVTAKIAPHLESISRGSAGVKHTYVLGGREVALTDREIFRMATNYGNAGNRQRLLDGEGWTAQEVEALFVTRLTKADWDGIQGIWDVHEGLRPEVGRVARKINGKEPIWVEALPFSIATADGQTAELRGGYVPIKKDIRRSTRAAEQAAADIHNGTTARATVRSGMTQARAERVMGQPLDYTMGSLFAGLDETIHYIAWAEWQMDMNRLLGDNAFTRMVRERYGADALDEMHKWRNDIITGNARQAQAGDAIASFLRGNISMANIGFSTMSAIAQIFGLFQSIVRVGAGEVGNAALRYLADFRAMGKQADEQSALMRNRSRTLFRELNDLKGQVGEQSKAKALMGKYAYWMLLRMQRAVDVITWQAQFAKSLRRGLSEADAAAEADQAVIDSQGSGMVKDLSSIERGSEALKLFTVHYGFMNTVLNLNINTLTDKNAGVIRKFYNVMMLVFVMQMAEGAFRALITPGDDDEWETDKLLPMAAGKILDGSLGQFVFLREFAGGFGNYEGTIGTGLFPRARKAWHEIQDGDFDTGTLRAMVSVLGAATGAPSAQINRTIKGIEALATDKTDNPFAVAAGFKE